MKDVLEAAEKIKNMEVRGAARIAKFAALTLKNFAKTASDENFDHEMREAAKILLNTRPTAVSLYNAISYIMRYTGKIVEEKRQDAIRKAEEFISWVENAQRIIGEIGERRIRDGSVVMTHCNSSSVLSILKRAHEKGKKIEVIATESRPRWQGRLTARQLRELGIEVTLIVDSAVRYFMNDVDCVLVGADAITANGALINKIGTSQIALIAKESRKPFMVAAETYKFSPKTLYGELVDIEERDAEEVAPKDLLDLGVKVRNPAFDVTPRSYIDVIITEIGVITPEMAYIVIKERLGYSAVEDEIKIDLSHFDEVD
ncbi:MAG: ribose 1,5-bisphosphate isomerase [Archaeoglobales archaeon]|nr:ribose 1,5-bisphosphate isomerase [Archaeoglobales archaeon]